MSVAPLLLRSVPVPTDWDDARSVPAALVRARIYDAIVRAVAEKGYAATTIADVTQRSKISRATFYDQFTDKEDCLLGAFDAATDACLSEITAALAGVPEDDWRQRLEVGLGTYVQILAEDPELAQVMIIDILGAGPKAIRAREAVMERYTDFYRRVCARAAEAESLPPIPDSFPRAFVGAIAELINREIVTGKSAQLENRIPELVLLALTMLGARPAIDRD